MKMKITYKDSANDENYVVIKIKGEAEVTTTHEKGRKIVDLLLRMFNKTKGLEVEFS